VKDPWKYESEVEGRTRDKILKEEFRTERDINELQFILRDILHGDNSLRDRPEYAHLNFNAIQAALSWLSENNEMDPILRSSLLLEPWKINFKTEPPTPDEFLQEYYIGPMVENLWRPIRRAFIDFFNPLKSWRTAVLCSSIGSGKSTLVCLIYAYISVCFALMWSPHKTFSKMSTSVFAMVFCAVSQKKSSEVYLEPILQLYESSPFFKRLRTHGEMKEEERRLFENETVEYVPFTTSTPSSVLQTGGGLNYKLISSANSLLGVNILCGSCTELSFFHEAGWALDYDEEVLMKDGSFKKMRDLQIGDELSHPLKKDNEVVKIPFDDEDDLYEIEFEDGRTVRCNLNHWWKVSFRKNKFGEKIWELVQTKFMMAHPELEFEIPETTTSKSKEITSIETES
jgi:hypothetical protein